MPDLYPTELKFLRREIEDKINKLGKPAVDIVSYLQKQYPDSLRKSTLDRIWRHPDNGQNSTHIENTLNMIVSKILGYDNWDEFNDYMQKSLKEELLFNPDSIIVDDLNVGDIITLGWRPRYYCKLKYINYDEFEVIESVIKEFITGEFIDAHYFYVEYDDQIKKDGKGFPLYPTIGYSIG